jgi:23S rRNA maturation-related 3'-5' exoribonuclease YhaM
MEEKIEGQEEDVQRVLEKKVENIEGDKNVWNNNNNNNNKN